MNLNRQWKRLLNIHLRNLPHSAMSFPILGQYGKNKIAKWKDFIRRQWILIYKCTENQRGLILDFSSRYSRPITNLLFVADIERKYGFDSLDSDISVYEWAWRNWRGIITLNGIRYSVIPRSWWRIFLGVW